MRVNTKRRNADQMPLFLLKKNNYRIVIGQVLLVHPQVGNGKNRLIVKAWGRVNESLEKQVE